MADKERQAAAALAGYDPATLMCKFHNNPSDHFLSLLSFSHHLISLAHYLLAP